MSTLHLLFNHTLTPEQKADAVKSLKVDNFINLPADLQQLWSNIPADLESLNDYLKPLETYLKTNIKRGDYILIQGDFGAVHKTVGLIKSLCAVPIYATTKRDVVETLENNTVVKKSVFKHERFRRYE